MPLTRSSRHSTPDAACVATSWPQSPCSAAFALVYTTGGETRNGNHLGQRKMAWGNFPSHVALVILIILCCRVILKDIIFTLYRYLDIFPLKRVRLHSASMFIYIIYSIFECCGVVFTSNKTCSVWFSLSAHALIKLDIFCLQMERHFLSMLNWPVYHWCKDSNLS